MDELLKHKRKSIRIKEFDYSQPNWYYITICSYDKKCIFGRIQNGEMILNEYGKVVEEELLKSPNIRKEIEIDYYVIMPNHIRAIIIINDEHHKNNLITPDVGANGISPVQSGNEIEIDFEYLTSGVYFVVVDYAGKRSVIKILK